MAVGIAFFRNLLDPRTGLGDRSRYAAVAAHLRHGDHYMMRADFASYAVILMEAAELRRTLRAWCRRSLFNIAGASAFSSDATVHAYAREIWAVTPVKADLGQTSHAD